MCTRNSFLAAAGGIELGCRYREEGVVGAEFERTRQKKNDKKKEEKRKRKYPREERGGESYKSSLNQSRAGYIWHFAQCVDPDTALAHSQQQTYTRGLALLANDDQLPAQQWGDQPS